MKTLKLILSSLIFSMTVSAQAGSNLSLMPTYAIFSGSGHNGFESGSFGFGAQFSETVNTWFEPGVFFDFQSLSTTGGNSASMIFYGASMRFNLGLSMGFFLDAKVGPSHGYASADSKMALGYGVGAGFKFLLGPSFYMSPRVGFRSLTVDKGVPGTTQRSGMDFGLMFTYELSPAPTQ